MLSRLDPTSRKPGWLDFSAQPVNLFCSSPISPGRRGALSAPKLFVVRRREVPHLLDENPDGRTRQLWLTVVEM